MSLQACMQATTIDDFEGWQEFFAMEMELVEKRDFYQAQIACEIRRSGMKDPNKININDFLLRDAEKKPKQTKAQAIEASKAFWFGIAGVKREPDGAK